MKYLQSYLYQRVYSNADRNGPEQNKWAFWNKILGEDLLGNLYKNEFPVRAYLSAGKIINLQKNLIENEGFISEVSVETIWEVERFLAEERKHGTFAEFYSTFLVEGYENLLLQIGGFQELDKNIQPFFLKKLLCDLQVSGTRILISEMYEKKKNGDLVGNTSEEEYISFVEVFLKFRTYQAELLEKYPVLFRCLKECMVREVEYFSELIKRIRADKREIEEIVLQGEEFNHIKGIDINLADSHNGGRSVTKLELDNGKFIIYKPHGMENEKYFYEFLEYMGMKCGVDMLPIKMITKENYGWSEYIEQAECQENRELERYYKRIGVCLFVSYLLGTNDIHFENIIAMGEYPVIVDLESLIGIRNHRNMQSQQKIKTILEESVLSAGILPCFYWNKDGDGIDISAVGGGAGIVPLQIPIIKLAGTSDMHIAYEQGKLKKAKNLARQKGKFMHPRKFENNITDGFEACYEYVVEHKTEMKEFLERIETVKSRYILADTQKYSMLLNSSYHPSVMQDGADREILLYSLWRGRNLKSNADRYVVESEVYDLLNQDIPYFYFAVNEKSLYNSRGIKYEEYFTKIPMEKICERLDYMGQEDLKRQKMFIHLSLSPAGKEKTDDRFPYGAIRELIETDGRQSQSELKNAVKCIADKLVNEAMFDERDKQISWLSYRVMNGVTITWNLQPCSIYLYDGIAGIAIFFHQFTQFFKEKKYLEICEILDKQLFEYTNLMEKKIEKNQTANSGLYTGEASLLYTYLLLYQICEDETYLEYSKKHAEIVYQSALVDQSYDLLEGKAGAVWALCEMTEIIQEYSYIEKAEVIADDIVKNAIDMQNGIGWVAGQVSNPLLGMAHGTAGIITALCKLYKITGNAKLHQCIKDAVVYEHENFNKNTGDWIDFREGKGKQNNNLAKPAAWCNGAGGILLSRLEICEIEWGNDMNEIIKLDIERAASYLRKNWIRDELCICHGECGNLMIWDRYNELIGGEEPITNLCKRMDDTILSCEWYNPGIMNGYTGIGCYFLGKLDQLRF